MDSEKLARALADRFQRIMPQGYYVHETGGILWYEADAPVHGDGSLGSYITEDLNSGGDTVEEQVTWCAEHALSELQDYLDETSTEPWPGERTLPVPKAHAAVIEGKLHMWFGDADAPVLKFAPIGLASLD